MPKITHNDFGIWVRPAEQEDVHSLVPRLRDSDVVEVSAVCGDKTVAEAMSWSLSTSAESYVLMVDDSVEALWGVNSCRTLPKAGIPWLVGSERMTEVSRAIARHSVGWAAHLMRNYYLLYNFVHVPHIQSQKWLSLCGFQIQKDRTYKFTNEDFYLFTMGAKACAA